MPSRNCRTIDGVAWRYNDSGSQCIGALCARIVEGNYVRLLGSSIRNRFFSYGFPWTNGPVEEDSMCSKELVGFARQWCIGWSSVPHVLRLY